MIVEEILGAEREHSLGIRVLGAPAGDQLRALVFSRYGGSSSRLWAVLSGSTSVQDAEAWRWIGDFVGPRSCVLFLDLPDGAEMFHVPSGASLHELLAETYGFVFYVTDADASYLVAFNDHDFLVCCGAAREWLEGRI